MVFSIIVASKHVFDLLDSVAFHFKRRIFPFQRQYPLQLLNTVADFFPTLRAQSRFLLRKTFFPCSRITFNTKRKAEFVVVN